jgi:ADP-heptose:LPS heptosyltransferase
MHMARALSVPTLAFFGSTDPAQFRFDGHALAYAGVECAPCSLHGLSHCPRKHFRCMNDLDVDRAFAMLTALLSGPERAPVTD